MKKMKSGFTLAEVLITLGIIGVIAAIVMPSVMTNYTYKTVGVKLSKFMSQLEGAARPYVVQNTVFSDKNSVTGFLNESFLISSENFEKEKITCTKTDGKYNDERCKQDGENVVPTTNIIATNAKTTFEDFDSEDAFLKIKDGTRLQAYMLLDYDEATNNKEINVDQVGEVVFGIAFAPSVQGLPKQVNKTYNFLVTELGYVYPDRKNDKCLSGIYDAEFQTNSTTFTNSNCKKIQFYTPSP